MNKLVIDNLYIDDSRQESIITLQNDTMLYLQSESDIYIVLTNDLTLDVLCSSKSKLHLFNNNYQLIMNVDIEENADLEIELSLLASKYAKNQITITHHYQKSKSQISTHGITYGCGVLELIVNGVVSKGLSGCVCNQASQIINLNQSKSMIEPNLFIDEYDVVANHAAYIGDYPQKKVFYLQTKGIMLDDIYQLLSFAFLKQNSLNHTYNKVIEEKLRQICLLGGEISEA